jgi:hypothetical protein
MLPGNKKRDISGSEEEISLGMRVLKGGELFMVKIKIYSNRPAGKR